MFAGRKGVDKGVKTWYNARMGEELVKMTKNKGVLRLFIYSIIRTSVLSNFSSCASPPRKIRARTWQGTWPDNIEFTKEDYEFHLAEEKFTVKGASA